MTLLDGTEVNVGDVVRVKSTGRWKRATVLELLKGGGVDRAVVQLPGAAVIRSRYQIRKQIRRATNAASHKKGVR